MDGLFPSLTIAVLGLMLMAGQQLAPVGGGPLAVIVPPWQRAGLARLAALEMPILDIRHGGRVIVVDAGAGGAGRLWRAGLWPVAGGAPATCLTRSNEGTG